MDTLEAIQKRRSIRSFRSDPIPADLVPALEESLLSAPSAGNLQSRHFYFVFRREILRKIATATYSQQFVAEVPLAVVCCADLGIGTHYGRRGRSLYCIQDVAASVQNLLLAAHSLGLGTVWVSAFEERQVSKILGIPKHLRPVAIVPVGYPAEHPSPPERVPRERALTRIP